MGSNKPLFAGFDLGTTNSAAAVFDGDEVQVVRSDRGAPLTPSVVRIDGRGRVTVGERAARFLERDAANTKREFKRLMGTEQALDFPASGESRKPEELAAEVLRSLRHDVQNQLGVLPERAVISVPALFELPQSAATSEAARLAGFEYVELIQEPVASALAAGWRDDDGGSWMVYDLGGGTFDVSLLETRDGLLRVVGHDGDNFLGGRDCDRAIENWAIERIAEEHGVELERQNPDHAAALGLLKAAAEDAKIQLSRDREADLIAGAPLVVDGKELELDLVLDRATLERLCTPMIDRTLTVCRRLLTTAGLAVEDVGRMVLVGGPTVMPFLRAQLTDKLGVDIAEGYDPMTLVAQGAALYAATSGIDGRPAAAPRERPAESRQLWLQYPPVSADLTPHVLGRVVGEGPALERIRLVRSDGKWQSGEVAVDDSGAFVASVELMPRRPNHFTIEATGAGGANVAVDPDEISIIQGVTIGDPPLSRSVGVALANDAVHVYFERGTALPARRTFTHCTVETVARGSDESVLKIPMVQGELDQAHLCRLVGTLEIGGGEIGKTVPSGTNIEVTIEIDRGGRMSASAFVPTTEQRFDSVAHLVVPEAGPKTLAAAMAGARTRITDQREQAFRRGDSEAIKRLQELEKELAAVEWDMDAARGGDHDAGQKAARTLLEIDASLADAELASHWPELQADARDDLIWAIGWISDHGTATEKRLIEQIGEGMERALERKDVREVSRQRRAVRRLGNAAFHRHPQAWEWLFEDAASRVHEATDLPAAELLVRKGRALLDNGEGDKLRPVVTRLWELFPPDAEKRRLSFDSGVR
jgi:molecular chaperone DnaK